MALAGQRLKGWELGKNIVDRLGVIGRFLSGTGVAVVIFRRLFRGFFHVWDGVSGRWLDASGCLVASSCFVRLFSTSGLAEAAMGRRFC